MVFSTSNPHQTSTPRVMEVNAAFSGRARIKIFFVRLTIAKFTFSFFLCCVRFLLFEFIFSSFFCVVLFFSLFEFCSSHVPFVSVCLLWNRHPHFGCVTLSHLLWGVLPSPLLRVSGAICVDQKDHDIELHQFVYVIALGFLTPKKGGRGHHHPPTNPTLLPSQNETNQNQTKSPHHPKRSKILFHQ